MMRRLKFDIRISKAESRNKSDVRTFKAPRTGSFGHSIIPVLSLSRISCFGFQIFLPLVACLVMFGLCECAGAQPSERALQIYQEKHQELHQELAASLNDLAGYCEQNKFPAAARRIRELAAPMDLHVLRVESLPEQVQPEIPLSLSPEERHWRVQLRHVQQEYAKDLYLLSRRVLHAGFPSYAYELVREVARQDPDHEAARRLLGYVRYGDEWVTPYAAYMLRRRYDWHDKFGWLPKADVDRYEHGERHFKGRWITADHEAEIRRDFDNAWEVRTDHYLVKTNHSLERGVEIASALEDFYRFFVPTFTRFFTSPEQMEKLFEGTSRTARRGAVNRPYEVHYYRTREEYNRRLVHEIPQIAITNGLYLTNHRVAYFFDAPDQDLLPTLYHEAAHQLFYESTSRDRSIAEDADFWIVEGISCYLESFRNENGRMSLGDPEYIRFQAARHRYLDKGYYVPLQKFAAMGLKEFQNSPDISKNYSQASGLAHFFMHYEGGRYRDALIEHLSQIYRVDSRRRNAPQSLEELTGVKFAELDRQYGEYLKEMQAELDRSRQ